MEENRKFLIVGLGNPGEEYANTRHNIGYSTLDAFGLKHKQNFLSGRYGSMAKMNHKGRTFILLKPSTFMNLSGKAVKYWLAKEKIPIHNLLIICDDIALPAGSLRIRKKGGDGGHNGLNNIIYELVSEDFPRLRIGVGSEFSKGFQVNYVLGKWTRQEEEILLPKIQKAVEMIESFALEGIGTAMNKFNNK